MKPLGTRVTFLDDQKYGAFLDEIDSEH